MYTLRNRKRFYEGGGPGGVTPPGGQAPQGAPPQAGGGQPNDPASGGGQPQQNTQDIASLPEWAQALIRKEREDAGNYRNRAKDRDDLAKKLKDIEDAQLSELDKAKKLAQEAEDRAKAIEAERRADRLTLTIEREARKLNIVDPEMAALAIQSKVEYDKDGQPTNVADLLKTLVKDKPFLVASEDGGGGTPPSNPPRTGSLSIEQIKKMTSQQIAALPQAEYDKVMAAVQKQ